VCSIYFYSSKVCQLETIPAALGSADSGMQQGHHDALIEQLAQRQQAFNQLGSMLGAMQQTSDLGSVEVLRTKLKVLTIKHLIIINRTSIF